MFLGNFTCWDLSLVVIDGVVNTPKEGSRSLSIIWNVVMTLEREVLLVLSSQLFDMDEGAPFSRLKTYGEIKNTKG